MITFFGITGIWFASSIAAAYLHYLLVRNNPKD